MNRWSPLPWLDRIAGNARLAMAAVGGTSLVVALLLVWGSSLPVPRIHDEFSYLLSADTFAHGRATNPPHPMWVHFESFHIIQQPTYSSKYPVGQGLSLAVGQVLTGHAIVGVWLTIAAACMAVTWMLGAWVPPRWALAGGVLMAIHPQVLQWDHTYWGGGVALLGGALVAGAARRLMEAPRAGTAAIMAAGLAVLANSRPFEGLVLGLVVAGSTLAWLLRRGGPPWRVIGVQVIAPAALVLLSAGALMAYHNWRVTGSPLRLPYMVHEAAYATIPPFGWQARRAPPVYRHDVMRRFWVEGWGEPPAADAPPRPRMSPAVLWLRRYAVGGKVLVDAFALNGGLLLALAGLPFCLRRDPWTRWAVAALALGTGGILLGSWMQVHYAAPLVPLCFLVVVVSLRELGRHAAGRVVVAAVAVLSLLALGLEYRGLVRFDDQAATRWFTRRAALADSLAASGEPALVVVRYQPRHPVLEEWVYNDADIDASPVVWAREMDPAQNQRLFAYFKDRRIWLLEADVPPWRLVPYEGAGR